MSVVTEEIIDGKGPWSAAMKQRAATFDSHAKQFAEFIAKVKAAEDNKALATLTVDVQSPTRARIDVAGLSFLVVHYMPEDSLTGSTIKAIRLNDRDGGQTMAAENTGREVPLHHSGVIDPGPDMLKFHASNTPTELLAYLLGF